MKRILIEIGAVVALVLGATWFFHARMAAHEAERAAVYQKAAAVQEQQARAAKAAAIASDADAAAAKATVAHAAAEAAKAKAKADDLAGQVAALRGEMGPIQSADHEQLVALVEKQDEEITALNGQVDTLTVKSAADDKLIASLNTSVANWHASSDHFEQEAALKQLEADARVSSAEHGKWNLGFKVAGTSVVVTAVVVEILDHRKR